MVRVRQIFYAATYLAGIFSSSGPAQAQITAADKAVAETLFDDGLALLRAGNLSAACPQFEQSQRIDSAVGTLLYLGECYERTGRTASAWATYREAASAATASGQASRGLVAKDRARALEPRLIRVSFLVAAANDMPGFEVRRDDKLFSRALYGVSIPLDPGEHILAASAPGYLPFETKFSLSPGKKRQTIKVPALQLEPVVVAAPKPAPQAAPKAVQRPKKLLRPQTGKSSNSGSGQRIWGGIVGGAGLVGVGVGVWFGLDAVAKDDEAAPFCDGARCSSIGAQLASEDAQSSALIANIAYGVGGAAILTGVLLLLTADDDEESGPVAFSPVISEVGAGLNLRGQF